MTREMKISNKLIGDGHPAYIIGEVGINHNGDIGLKVASGWTYLTGNPYPSAMDANQFIDDNKDDIRGTIYFWEHWGGGSHALKEYQGGYATYNLSGGTVAVAKGTP